MSEGSFETAAAGASRATMKSSGDSRLLISALILSSAEECMRKEFWGAISNLAMA